MLTVRAMRDFHLWLAYCLDRGWPASTKKELTDLWWKYHDDEGNLTTPNRKNNGKPLEKN